MMFVLFEPATSLGKMAYLKPMYNENPKKWNMNNQKEREGNTQTNLWLSSSIFRKRPFFLSYIFFSHLSFYFLLITF